MAGAYRVPLDIANRACDHVGARKITVLPTVTVAGDDTVQAEVFGRSYDLLRDAELRRNVWRFSIRKAALRAVDTNTMFLVPETYSSADSYPQGSIVAYNNLNYISRQFVPVATPPGTPNEAFWWVYFGPLTVTPWNPTSPPGGGNQGIPAWSSTVTYTDGQYVVGSDNLVYVLQVGSSLNQNPVTDNGVHWVWTGTSAAGTTVPTYYAGELVYNVVGGVVSVYQCLNTGTTDDPTAAPAAWLSSVTYNIGDTVTSSSQTWESQVDLNTGNTPAVGIYWQAVPAAQAQQQVGQNWMLINATIRFQRLFWPIGSGPRNQSTTRNIYRLPSGYLRKAPQDPTAGATSYLGAPANLPDEDWTFEGDYIVTRESQVIILRFVADVQDVSDMDPMFCEGLGARMGFESGERITQSAEKIQTCAQTYKLMMGEARAVNGIETSPTEPPLDDYITTRI